MKCKRHGTINNCAYCVAETSHDVSIAVVSDLYATIKDPNKSNWDIVGHTWDVVPQLVASDLERNIHVISPSEFEWKSFEEQFKAI